MWRENSRACADLPHFLRLALPMNVLPLSYRCRIERRADGFHFRFPDLPEADFVAASLYEGKTAASEHIAQALVGYIREGRCPKVERAHAGESVMHVTPSLGAKMLFLAKSAELGMYPAELARRLNMKPQEVHRIYKPDHATKIDQLEEALNALGWRLTLGVAPIHNSETPSQKQLF